jgi:hypothetical protein
MATTLMKDLMGLRRWALLAAGVMIMSALALSLGAANALAYCRCPEEGAPPSFYTSTWPTVTQVSPQDGATLVPTNTNVKVTFSEEVDPSTVNGSTLQLHTFDSLFSGGAFYYTEQIPATVSKDPTDATGRTYLLDTYGETSTTLLSANRKYRVTVTTGVRDLDDGLPITSNKVWYFTTGSS